MRFKRRPVSKTCAHYREIISECKNCDADDAPYKICFLKKRPKKETHHDSTYPGED